MLINKGCMSFRNYISENVFLPISDLIAGQNVARSFRFLKETDGWSQEQVIDFQNKRLRMLIRHAVESVPYYNDLFKSLNLSVDDIQTKNDLRKLPIVDKSIMRREGGDRFVSNSYPVKKRVSHCSSGSTGEPFSYFTSKESDGLNTAAKLSTWYQAGYRMGDKYIKIANGERQGVLKKLQDRMNNCIFVPFYSISDDNLKAILRLVEEEKPSIIRSYPIPIYLLAQCRLDNPDFVFCPKHIMTTGSTLSTAYRELIEKAFCCDVIDSYSCEGTPNTYETVSHDGYKVSDAFGIIEVLDENDNVITDGVGRVISTDLWNFAQPFIRYDAHDLVEVRNGKITRIMGRECDSLVCSGGIRYTVHNFSRFFLHEVSGVTAYQVVKKKDGSILFNLEVNNDFDDTVKNHIVKYWSEQLQKSVRLEIVPSIPLMKNNKRRVVVDEE